MQKMFRQEHTQFTKQEFQRWNQIMFNALERKSCFWFRSSRSKTCISAREAGDIKSEVEAQKEIARLGVDEARVKCY